MYMWLLMVFFVSINGVSQPIDHDDIVGHDLPVGIYSTMGKCYEAMEKAQLWADEEAKKIPRMVVEYHCVGMSLDKE